MRPRPGILAVAAATLLLGFVGIDGAASASTPISLLLPQGTAAAILGRSCNGIREGVFATGFDATSGYPMGAVTLATTCTGGSGKGGGGARPYTYTAWASALWDFTGAVISAGKLSAAPTVDTAFMAFDAHGNEVYNATNQAYLVLAPGFVPAPRITGMTPTLGPA